MHASGHTSSNSVVLVALQACSQADRFVVESVLRADSGAGIGGLREILSELASGSDLAGSSHDIEAVSVDAAGAGSCRA